ncbi:MAG: hypothetical protein DDT26_02083 [Dehalococcoidia bacterium]|nr:hypothetical protein [Chloroflexota bacterium]
MRHGAGPKRTHGTCPSRIVDEGLHRCRNLALIGGNDESIDAVDDELRRTAGIGCCNDGLARPKRFDRDVSKIFVIRCEDHAPSVGIVVRQGLVTHMTKQLDALLGRGQPAKPIEIRARACDQQPDVADDALECLDDQIDPLRTIQTACREKVIESS